jgi:hypothetical protein
LPNQRNRRLPSLIIIPSAETSKHPRVGNAAEADEVVIKRDGVDVGLLKDDDLLAPLGVHLHGAEQVNHSFKSLKTRMHFCVLKI